MALGKLSASSRGELHKCTAEAELLFNKSLAEHSKTLELFAETSLSNKESIETHKRNTEEKLKDLDAEYNHLYTMQDKNNAILQQDLDTIKKQYANQEHLVSTMQEEAA